MNLQSIIMAPQRNLHEGCSQPNIAILERLSIQSTLADQASLSQLDPVTLTSYDLLPTKGQTEIIVVPGE
jgi:hypothetical protein